MKQKLLALLIACSALAVTGCNTTKNANITEAEHKALKVARVHRTVTRVVYIGMTADLVANPQHRVPALEAANALDLLVEEKNWDVGTALDLFAKIGAGKLQDGNASLYITLGVAGVEIILDNIGLDSGADLRDNAYAEAVITGLSKGLNQALRK